MKNLFFFLIASVLLLAASCEKESPTSDEPPYHQDVFRCKVNGKEWKPSGGGGVWGGPSPLNVQYYFKDSEIGILAFREVDGQLAHQTMNFTVKGLKIGMNPIKDRKIFKDYSDSTCIAFYIDSTKMNNFYLLEIDTLKRRIKATFELYGTNDCNQTINVTNGYLDVAPFWNN